MLLKQIKNGENKKLELKKILPSSEKIAKTVVAFSNTAGGKLVIGVDDDKNIVGIDEDKIFEYEEKISSIISDMCYPNILPEIYAQNINGKVVLVIEVFRGSLMPYFLKTKGKLNGTYIRVGSTNRLADEMVITELQRQRLNKTFDEEENFEFSLDEFDLKVIYDEFSKIGKTCDYEKLKNLKLIKKLNGVDYPTNALSIVFGKFDNTIIKCARFKGTSKEIFIDKKEFHSNLFENLDNTIKFLQNHLNLGAKVEGLQLKEEFEIPLLALREALLNAIIHRDYTRNSDIKVAVYETKVEIVSPGNFPNGLSLDDVMNGRSELRNKVVANLFRELKYIENWGSGIEKIKKICEKSEVKFELKEEPSFVSVIFYRKNILIENSEKVSNSSEKPLKNHRKTIEKPVNLTKQEQILYDYILTNSQIDLKLTENLLNVKSARAREILSNMVKKSILQKIGKTKGSYYILKANNETKI